MANVHRRTKDYQKESQELERGDIPMPAEARKLTAGRGMDVEELAGRRKKIDPLSSNFRRVLPTSG